MTGPEVLLVDDDDLHRELVADYLTLGGFAVRHAADGREALAVMRRTPPAVVLLDVQMPELDGFELATMLKADPVTAAIPIIMVSAHEGRGARLIGLESGAEDYLSKPVDPAELIAKIRNLLLLRDRTIHSALH